jgi:uncharacterized protein YndB with AHSA1/START domain
MIRTEIRSKATPLEAFDAWADPEKMAHWFPDRAEGKGEPGATITWIFDKFDRRIPYEVLIAQLARKFAIRWNPPPGMNPGIVEVRISKEGRDTVVSCGRGISFEQIVPWYRTGAGLQEVAQAKARAHRRIREIG